MVPGLLTLLVMAIIAYAFWREGPLTAFAMCCNVVLAGLLAFNFWEPIAAALQPSFMGNFLEGTEDAIALMLLFCPTLMFLRWLTNSLSRTHMEFPTILYRGGSVLCGLLAGYFLSGFLLCVYQTLPVQQNFLGFDVYEPGKASPLRQVLPPDLVWLSMMHRLSGGGLASSEPTLFDRQGNFELRYERYRRLDSQGGAPLTYKGELEP
jgi:hypothetical protein